MNSFHGLMKQGILVVDVEDLAQRTATLSSALMDLRESIETYKA